MAVTPFNTIEVRTPQTNRFDLTHDNKLSLDMGYLYPVLTHFTYPGDSYEFNMEAFLRFAPTLYPIMHKIDMTIHLFYVPIRIIWRPFEKFIGGVTGIAPPYIQGTDSRTLAVNSGDFLDYLGLPNSTNVKEPINCWSIFAWMSIINQYYQDQNNDSFYPVLRDQLEVLADKQGLVLPTDLFSPDDTAYVLGMFQRAWEHDMFTSALPFAQKGPAVQIPVTLNDLPVEIYSAIATGGGTPTAGAVDVLLGGPTPVLTSGGDPVTLTGIADGSGAALEGTINQLRVSYALQRYYELNARAGTRYNETLLARWGVNIKDERISRPEYLGGIKNNVVISEVLQTSATGGDSALGQYAGHITGMAGGQSIKCYCPEHGYIIACMSVIPKTAYFQGIPKHFSYLNLLDLFTPEFAHIGEQEVKNKELYYDNTLTDNNDAFGYMPMGYELKTIPSGVHGQFRDTLLPFHLARKFDNRPVLNSEFIYCKDDKRIFAVTDPDVQSLYAHVLFQISSNRKIPYFSTPI